MSFNGKWRAVEINDPSAMLDFVHAKEEYKQQVTQMRPLLKSHPDLYVEEIHVDKAAGTFKRLCLGNGQKGIDSVDVKFGVEIDGFAADGQPAKVKYILESDTKIVLHEKGDGFYIRCTFEVSGNHLTATAVADGLDSPFIIKFQRA